MAELPHTAQVYKTTPEFTEKSVPAGLLREHRTKPGVWARVVVRSGRLRFRELPHGLTVELAAGDGVVAAPEQPHEVEVVGAVRFVVEFLRDG